MIVSFEDLQKLSGCKQTSKVLAFLRASSIPHVVGQDGKPRTTHEWLNKWLEKSNGDATTEVRFKV